MENHAEASYAPPDGNVRSALNHVAAEMERLDHVRGMLRERLRPVIIFPKTPEGSPQGARLEVAASRCDLATEVEGLADALSKQVDELHALIGMIDL